jgi:parallel beta-helix repeat protein
MEDRAVPAAGFFEGFELGSSGWLSQSGGEAVRVASGTDGIASQAGGFHARVTGSVFTRWGGYTNVFPAGGYLTSIGIYLDVGISANNDTRFDFSSAVNKPDGNHRRDFAFNAGYYNDAGEGPRFVISASNSTGRPNSFPKNPGRDPFAITTSGWYTFQHRFFDSGNGVLAVQMSIKDASGATLHSWTLSDSTDIIGSTVGGNRYGFFATQELPFLAIDNSFESNPSTVYVDDDWASLPAGTDPDGSGPANLLGFDAFSSIQDAINAAAVDGTVHVAAGTYLESVTVNKPVTLLGAQAGLNPAGRTDPAVESIVSAPSGTNGFSIGADNVTIRGFTVTTAGGVYGVAETTPVSGTNIDRNIVSGFGGVGIALAAGSNGAAVTENDVSNNYAGIYLSTGASNVTVRANVVHDNTGTGSDAGSGIVFEGNNTNVLVSQNFIRDNDGSGIYVWSGFGNDFSGTKFTSNSITGNDGAGFNNTNAAIFDASGNWWDTSAAVGVAAEVTGDVDFMPYLVSGEDTDLLTAGFQGNANVAPGQGNVRVKVVGGRLMITGDNLDNLVTVEMGPTANSYRVTGLYGTQINGLSGSDGFVFENVTRGIDANLKRGNDMFVLDGSASAITAPGTIKVRSGRGDDLVRLDGLHATGRVLVEMGRGNDLLAVSNSTFDGPVTWNGGFDDDEFLATGSAFTEPVHLIGRSGADRMTATESSFDAKVIANGGAGADVLDFTDGNTMIVPVQTIGVEAEME